GADNRFTLCNPAAAAALGYDDPDEVVARHPAEHSPELQLDGRPSRDMADEMMATAHRDGVHRFEWTHRRRDGSLFPVEVTLAEITMAGERQLYCVWRDISARKRYEADLEESRARHEDAQRLASFGHWQLDLRTNVLGWSDEVYRIFDIERVDAPPSYESFLARIHPDDRDRVDAAYERSVRDRSAYDIEHRIRLDDGAVKWVHERGMTFYDSAGEPLRSVGTVLDITTRHETEASLRSGNDFLQGIIANAAEGVSVCSAIDEFPHVRFSVWNERMTEITGYTMAEINRLGWYQSMYPDPAVQRQAIERMDRMRTGDNLVAEEWEVTTKAGERRTLAISTSMITLADGTPAVIGLMQDVTSRIRAAEALHRSEQKYRGIFDESVAAIYVFDMDKRFVDTNQAGADLLGYARDELLRLCIADIDADPEVVLPAHARLAEGERLVNFQHRLRRKDGRIVTVLDNSRPLTGSDGTVVGMQSTLVDITELQQAQEERAALQGQLHDARRMEAIGRLAGGVAHDFNNMLSIILGGAELALENMRPGDQALGDLKEIQEAAERSAELTRQLLAFARRQPTTPVLLDLNDKVESMLRMLRRVIGENISLVWTPGPEVWPVRVDASQLDQVLANLSVNARDAISGAGTVRISTANVTRSADEVARHRDARPGDHVLLAFGDDGCGMEAEALDHVFEPFYTTKKVGQGTGLGLATVYGIVHQNGGHIEVDSSPGHGSTFRIYLPAVRDATPDRQQATGSDPRVGHETVLLVEDEPSLMRMTRRMLERLGYSVVTAGSATAALQIVDAPGNDFDLVMSDVVMPDLNGFELAQRLRQRRPGLLTLLMSGYPAEQIPSTDDLGPDTHFISKPFTVDGIAAKLRDVFGPGTGAGSPA
ncbi:MAG: PAS domain S-box protein, partial [Planctomycetes bacterium]|nr:PAS domain S-box protein [Planctomycetota bacterium]